MARLEKDSVYRRINQLTAVQIASMAVVVLLVAILAILLHGEVRGVNRRLADVEDRLASLEQGRPSAASDLSVMPSSESVDGAPASPAERGGLGAAELSRLARTLATLADDLPDEPTAQAVEAAGAALRELERSRVAPTDLDARTAARVARLYLAVERFEKAAEWAAVASEGGASKEAECVKAKAYYSLGRYEPALEAVRQCASPGAVEPSVVLLKGRIELALGQSAKGEATLGRALKMDEVAADAGVFLAEWFLKKGAIDRAGEVIDRAHAVAPNRQDIARTRAAVLLARGQYSECIEIASILLAVDERDAAMLRVMGEALLGAQRAAEAVERLETLVQLRPSDAAACDLMGRAFLAQLQAAEAGQWFARATRLAPEDAKYWYHLGVAHSNGGDSGAAVEAFDQALRVNSEYANAHFARAVCLARDGDVATAQVSLQRALALDAPLVEQAEQVEAFRGILATGDGRPAPGP